LFKRQLKRCHQAFVTGVINLVISPGIVLKAEVVEEEVDMEDAVVVVEDMEVAEVVIVDVTAAVAVDIPAMVAVEVVEMAASSVEKVVT